MGYRYLNVHINSANDACISCENFVKFGPVTPELIELICERLVRHGYLRVHWTDFCNLYTIESDLGADDGSVAIFQFVMAHCHGNQIMLRKCYQCRLIPLAFVALALENKLQYHGLAVCINSANNASISCENFIKFDAVTPEMTELICECQVQHGQKTGVFRISTDILDRFSQSFHHMKMLYVQMLICTLFSNMSRDIAMQGWKPRGDSGGPSPPTFRVGGYSYLYPPNNS